KYLVGKKYKPVFDYYQNGELKNRENGWEIVAADFVTTTDGTGVVHIAPAFGEDDYNLSLKENLPFIQHVGQDGAFKKEVTDFAGQQVKPKDDHQKADIEVIKYLAGKGTLFAKEKLVHSYPHCWRCDTPLLNYATSSWFVKVTDIKDKLVTENSKVNWVPSEIGEGRFGKWLENARDWAISRSRYWGAPLPVWTNNDKTNVEVIGSVDDIRKHTKRNTYFVIRHGEADSNKQNILSGKATHQHHLTEEGKKDIEKAAQQLKEIDLIISSPFVRTKESAEIIATILGIAASEIIYDDRLGEYDFGDFDGKDREAWHNYWKDYSWNDTDKKVPGGECPDDVRNRVGQFIYDIDKQYEGKTIVIVSHQDPISYLQCVAEGKNITYLNEEYWRAYALKNAEARELNFAFIPHNRNYELDLHRPYIDEVVWKSKDGSEMNRVPEVFDTWYESGSMPYASNHYPFENKELIDAGKFFPADFIAEGQDQTRGWFYSLLVLSTGLFGHAPYKSVVVNGTVLAEDGQKMSKRLKNYPELDYVLDKYGADAMRYYLMSSPVVHAEDLSFSEKGVDEVVKKLLMRLQNVYTFFATYQAEEKEFDISKVENILDRWILARLAELNNAVTQSLEKYELDRAAKPILDFVDDLSTWYLRRSRDRFKGDNEHDKQSALNTMHHVLIELSKLMAPFTPFIAEDLYQNVRRSDSTESVHLESWPVAGKTDEKLTQGMAEVRKIVSLGLEARAKANLKVRQPLQTLFVGREISSEYHNVILDELNVKEIQIDKVLEQNVRLDTTISPVLKLEGQAREFIRGVQELRKKLKFNPGDKVMLTVSTNEGGEALLKQFSLDISNTAQLSSVVMKNFEDADAEKIEVDDLVFVVTLAK
ncbi:MAG: Isoleucyl-tRNA synthetase, isoleucyl-tRNA synthetase, partial [Candidatus Paceibacter sp.]|nr:Isoleucyl-tRNA synthetase, isoleucyl-tRNA synthetase [Candidatus Paceibacter sp.]